jgi:uncharacterized protein with PQ loop repeat
MTGNYVTLYSTLGTASATLIGLLFVAISIVPERLKTSKTKIGVEIQASGCLFCFTDVLVISLLGLAQPASLGPTLLVLGVISLVYTLASLRSLIQSAKKRGSNNYSQLGFIATFAIIFVVQLYYGIRIATAHVQPVHPLGQFTVLPIVILLVGVARTWQLIGLRDTGILSSLNTLIFGEKDVVKKRKS